MYYSIGEVAKKMDITPSTLRYYDKKGLLPFVDRDASGRRNFKENDLNFLQVIDCMKKCGMKLEEIRNFIELCMTGDMTLVDRYELLYREKKTVEEQIKVLQEQLDFLHYKLWYYKTSVNAGTEDIHFTKTAEGEQVDPDIREQYEAELAKCHDLAELIELENEYRQNKAQNS